MMAAAVNANADAVVSPRASAGEGIGGPQTPPRRTSSGAARTASPPWSQVVRGSEADGLVFSPPPSVSLVTRVAPVAATEVVHEPSVRGKGGSSPEGFDGETQPEGSDNGNGSKKPAWSKRDIVAPESGLVMGAVSWPTLSESKKAPSKQPSADSSKNVHDAQISLPQVTAEAATSSSSSTTSAPQKQMNTNPNAPQHHGRPARQKSMKREGAGNSSVNGGFTQSSTLGDPSHANNGPSKSTFGTSDVSSRDHGHNNATRDGGHRSGGDHPHQRNYRRSNSGPHPRGDGSFGARRDQDRGNHDWNHNRSFNGRDPIVPIQRASPRGFIRPTPPGAAPFIPPPIRPYGGPMGIPSDMPPLYYFAPHPGMPFVAQMPPAVYIPPPDPQLHVKIVNQIDYYFSNENLIKDTYLRQNMDESGWVPVQLIANFKKVMQLTTDVQLILNTVRASAVVEVQGDKLRRRDDWMKWVMPPTIQNPAVTGSQSPRKMQNSLSSLVQDLDLGENISNSGSESQVDARARILLSSSSGDMNCLSENSKDGSSSGC